MNQVDLKKNLVFYLKKEEKKKKEAALCVRERKRNRTGT